MNDEAVQCPPAIGGTIDRARDLRNQVNQLVTYVTSVANRVCGEPAPTPEKADDGEDTSRVYNNSLTDTFLSIHDETEQAIAQLRFALNRIGSQV